MDGADQRVEALEFTVITGLNPGEIHQAGRLAAVLDDSRVLIESSVGSEGVVYKVRAGHAAPRAVLVLHWVQQDVRAWRVSLSVEDVASESPSAATDRQVVAELTAAQSFAVELHRRLTDR